jgi:hypothetical protein
LENCGKEFGDIIVAFFVLTNCTNNLVTLWLCFCLWQGIVRKNLVNKQNKKQQTKQKQKQTSGGKQSFCKRQLLLPRIGFVKRLKFGFA